MDKYTLKVIRENLKYNNLNDFRNEQFWNDIPKVCQLDFLKHYYNHFSEQEKNSIDKLIITYKIEQALTSNTNYTKNIILSIDYSARILKENGSPNYLILEFTSVY